MVQAARATAAAPTYFEPLRLGDATLVDGGVFAINPALCAYAEVGGKLDLLLSLGHRAGATRPLPYGKVKDWGELEWARPLIDVVFDGGQDAVDFQLAALIDGSYVRLQTRLEEASDDLDDASEDNLAALSPRGRPPDRRQRRGDRRRLRAADGLAQSAAVGGRRSGELRLEVGRAPRSPASSVEFVSVTADRVDARARRRPRRRTSLHPPRRRGRRGPRHDAGASASASAGWPGAESETGEVCSARRRTSRQERPSLTSAGAPITTAVATSTACRTIP